MLDFSVNSKSQLAKLLATENINIEHRNAPTASFNLETRTLVCPIWEDMSGQMYDLLLGHEVSHALETPKQGWHDAVCEKGRNYKHFLNVVEDARIEKKIKRRYPGIRRSFIGGYNQLLEKDFFGIANQDIDKLFFIDRLNIYCKAGINSNIKFNNAEEKALLKLVEDAETWNDVLYATDKVWEYSKEEQQQESPQESTTVYEYDENGEYTDEEVEYEDTDETEEGFPSDAPADSDDDNESDDSEESEESDDSAESSDDDNESDDSEESDDSAESSDDDNESETYGEPECITDKNFRKNEDKLLSSSVQAYNYLAIPQLISKEMITTAKDISKVFADYVDQYDINTTELYNDFKSKNEKYISLLAKEFEMRKAAKAHSRSKTASTGDINVNKIYKYLLDDEIFKKATIVPKGKSHGLVLLLDMSGSMSKNMTGSIEQIQVLASFCRKVNIPFTVYSFTSKHSSGFDINTCFEQEANTLQLEPFVLIEFISSKMKGSEFNTAIKNLSVLSKMYEDNTRRYVPRELSLGRTPLIESLITLKPIVKEFRKVNNLDIVNLVIVHDGDADTVNKYKSPGHEYQFVEGNKTQRYVLRDTKEKLDFVVDSGNEHTSEKVRKSIFEWFKQTTGTKIFGFFITGEAKHELIRTIEARYYESEVKKTFDSYSIRYAYFESKALQLKKEKLLFSKNPGYESFYLILGGKNLQIENEELIISGKVTTHKLFTSLRKLNKNKQVNRVLATQFIQGIAI